jgi:hypothetical protein
VFLILSFLEILAERRQKSISVEFNLANEPHPLTKYQAEFVPVVAAFL